MAVLIGSARIDERGRTSGGQAGDQKQRSTPDMAGEVSVEAFYVHSLGWYVLRPKTKGHELALCMLQACNNPNIGYDQNQRNGIITNGTASTVPTECDCSSLVRECVKETYGVDVGNINTSTEKKALLNSGLFTEVAYTSPSALREGDVLVTKTKGHTAIVVSDESAGVDVYYRVYANGKWLPEVKNAEDYAGIEKKPISGVMVRSTKGTVSVRVRIKGQKNYLPWVTGYDANDSNNGYAGVLGKPIDRVQMKVEGLEGMDAKLQIAYRVSPTTSASYYDWVFGDADYAGVDNKQIDKLQVDFK